MSGAPRAEPASAGGRESFPWYDSRWSSLYAAAVRHLRHVRPDALPGFVEAFRVLRTRPGFETRIVEPFDAASLTEIRAAVAAVPPGALETYEVLTLGRFLVHELPTLESIHRAAAPLVSELVGEDVEPSFRFLGLYSTRGVVPLHIDSPDSKWTIDLCIDQSGPWPIFISQVVDWPEPRREWPSGWEDAILGARENRFTRYVLQPGQAAVFSGSGQWHYRDPIPQQNGLPFCNQIFLQYVPRGSLPLLHPKQWPALFDIPELEPVVRPVHTEEVL